MSNQLRCQRSMLAASLALFVAGPVWAQASADHPVVQGIGGMKMMEFPGLPKCSTGSVLSGDPAKGPSIILAKSSSGCTVPWHWHTPNEHLMMVKGTARMEMKDAKPGTLRAGDYAMMPAKHVHQFTCTSSCVFYVHSDGAFDIHYVNAQGNELSADEALKPAKMAKASKQKQ